MQRALSPYATKVLIKGIDINQMAMVWFVSDRQYEGKQDNASEQQVLAIHSIKATLPHVTIIIYHFEICTDTFIAMDGHRELSRQTR